MSELGSHHTRYVIHDTVYVGLSGGVDSAVSAALLKQQGYNVVGVFIKIWRPEFIDCPWQKERLDALRVCAALEIPFKEIDLSDEYKKTVIDDMIDNYARGITPNPDVLCNRHIKFGAFAQWAFESGADFVATGHYAQIKIYGHAMSIYRGADTNKDQSYFLWQLTEKDLSRALFPVGKYTKPEVRSLARTFDLLVASKKDSQGLCFVGDVSMRDFLVHYLPLQKGSVFNEEGVVIGEHVGAALYTLGERQGLHIYTQTSHDVPRYVSAIDTKANTVTVSERRESAARLNVHLVETNWNIPIDTAKKYTAQARYREEPRACTVTSDSVQFEIPHLAPQGQSLVVYDGDLLVGGGIISA